MLPGAIASLVRAEGVAPGAGFEPAVGRLTGACVAVSPPWYLSLSTDSNGLLPGTSRVRRRLRLRGSVRRSSHRTTADLQTCDARSASALCSWCCSRGCCPRPIPTAAGFDPVLFEALALAGRVLLEQRHEVAPSCRGRNRTDRVRLMRPARVPTLPAERQTEHAAGIEPASPAWKAGASLRSATRAGCGRWPFRLGDLDKRASRPGTRFTTAHPGWPTRRRRRESNSRSAGARRRSGPVCRTDRHLVSTGDLRRAEESNL